MNVLIVYSSEHGNTKAIALAMGRELSPSATVDVRHAHDAMTVAPAEVDLLLVGAPTQQRGVPARIGVRDFVESLAGRGFAGIPAAAFDTRLDAPEHRTGSAAVWIETTLREAGCRIVVPRAGFVVEGSEGPLLTGEDERAAEWAMQAVVAAQAGASVPPAPGAWEG